jgi:hypothetical protein
MTGPLVVLAAVLVGAYALGHLLAWAIIAGRDRRSWDAHVAQSLDLLGEDDR